MLSFVSLSLPIAEARRRSSLSALAFLTSAVLAACKGDDEAPKVALEDFCFEFAMATCEGIENCCEGFGSGQDCLDSVFDSCERRLLTAKERDETTMGLRVDFEFDEEGAGALIDRVRSVFGRCEGELNPTLDDTHRLSELDGVCLVDTDCVAPLACLTIGSSDSGGRCVPGPEEGEECSVRCASADNVCRYESSESTTVCAPFIEEGEACSLSDPRTCSGGLYCKYCEGDCAATCTPFSRIGGECDGSSEACGPGARCTREDESSWVCEADDGEFNELCLFASDFSLGFQ